MEDYEGEKRYATYSRFAVASEDDNYRLKLGSYCGRMFAYNRTKEVTFGNCNVMIYERV